MLISNNVLSFQTNAENHTYVYHLQVGLFVGLSPVIQILCHVLARGWGRWLWYFTEAKAEVKYLSQRPNPSAKTWHKIWMTGLNPNYDTHSFPLKLTKQVPKILVYLRSPAPFDSAVTPSARPPNYECTHLLLRSADWWRHNILFSIARIIWIHSECKLSTDNFVKY